MLSCIHCQSNIFTHRKFLFHIFLQFTYYWIGSLDTGIIAFNVSQIVNETLLKVSALVWRRRYCNTVKYCMSNYLLVDIIQSLCQL